MGLFKKFGTLFRAGAASAEEALDDATMDVQLTQSLRDAKNNLAKADERRIKQRANVKGHERKVAELEEEFTAWTEKAKLAKSKNNLDLAKTALTKRNDINTQLAPAKALLEEMHAGIAETDKYYEQQKRSVTQLSSQIDSYQATQAMNESRASIQESLGTGRDAVGGLASTLERAKAKQAQKKDMLDAADDMNTDSKLDDQFKALENDFNLDDELNSL